MSGLLHAVLKRPVITEKSNAIREASNQYVFEVERSSTKSLIRAAVESIFSVRVVDVRTSIVRGKIKRIRRGIGKRPNWKKAVVTLRKGDHIDLFEGA
jgi:large subunit ribosomal protein L23